MAAAGLPAEEGWWDDRPTSVSKSLAVIRVLAHCDRGALGLTSLAAALGVPKSTVHRTLKVLEAEGFVARTGVKYRLGTQFFEVAHAARWSVYGELRDLAAPYLDDLFEQVQQTVHLAVPEGLDVMYLEKICASGGCRVPSQVGARMPATCTALGKALLACGPEHRVREVFAAPLTRITPYSLVDRRLLLDQLDQARREGIAYETEESQLGVRCVAVPVRVDGLAIAAISVAGPTSRFSVRSAVGPLVAAGERLEGRIAEVRPAIGRLLPGPSS